MGRTVGCYIIYQSKTEIPYVLSILWSSFRVCLVGEQSGTECHGPIPLEWVGSVLMFGRSSSEEWNGYILVFGLRDGI